MQQNMKHFIAKKHDIKNFHHLGKTKYLLKIHICKREWGGGGGENFRKWDSREVRCRYKLLKNPLGKKRLNKKGSTAAYLVQVTTIQIYYQKFCLFVYINC